MSRLISFVLADSSCEPREERELQNGKVLPTAGLEPDIARLLNWCSNRLCYRVRSDCRYLKVNYIHIYIDTR